MEYHQRAMQREDYLEVVNLRVLAVRKKGPTSEVMRGIRSLSEYLWSTRIPEEEVEIKRSVDALLA